MLLEGRKAFAGGMLHPSSSGREQQSHSHLVPLSVSVALD